ncbi:hypothetical protein T12_7754 [Trichinella patagoniensis]|uniref:Uncharacterized protein n=1 Tax=Trichinella patagoniensis TaxID=990121 RepID=A0A0V1A9G5_9BILA|nr:hypothetical protein T12_7754 [Trichinella patagoniensis]
MHMQAAVLKSKHCEAQPKSDLATVKHHSFHLFFLHRHFEVPVVALMVVCNCCLLTWRHTYSISAMVLFCGAVPFLTLASLNV